jgi:hypothetical protein
MYGRILTAKCRNNANIRLFLSPDRSPQSGQHCPSLCGNDDVRYTAIHLAIKIWTRCNTGETKRLSQTLNGSSVAVMQSLTCAFEALMCDPVEHGATVVAESWSQVRESLPLVFGDRRLAEIKTRNKNTETFTQRKQAGLGPGGGGAQGVHIIT